MIAVSVSVDDRAAVTCTSALCSLPIISTIAVALSNSDAQWPLKDSAAGQAFSKPLSEQCSWQFRHSSSEPNQLMLFYAN